MHYGLSRWSAYATTPLPAPVSERLLLKEFRAGTIILVDVGPDETGAQSIQFRTIDGFTPPPVEMAEVGDDR